MNESLGGLLGVKVRFDRVTKVLLLLLVYLSNPR